MQYTNFQLNSWRDLFQSSIHVLMENCSFTKEDVTVRFSAMNAMSFLNGGFSSQANSGCLKVKAEFQSSSRAISKEIELIQLPLFTEDGVLIDGNKWSLININHPASGWYITNDKDKCLVLRRNATKVLSICIPPLKSTTKEVTITAGNSTQTMSLYEFLKAMYIGSTGGTEGALSYQDIRYLFDDCPHVYGAFWNTHSSQEVSAEEAANHLLHVLTGRGDNYEWESPSTELAAFLEENRLRIGTEKIPRFKHFCSFSRAVGTQLASSVTLADGTIINKGETITDRIARLLDHHEEITQITVRAADGARYTLKKYTPGNTITFDEIVCALRVYDQYLSGIGTEDDPDEVCNKVVMSIREDYEDRIQHAMNQLIRKIQNGFSAASSDIVEYLAAQDYSDCLERLSDVSSRMKQCSRYQQFDETNSMATFDQSYKLTTEAKYVSDSARDIHPMQYGRICPYTTSESKRVGLNLVLTLTSELDEYGFITTPIYRFDKGKLYKTDKPTYISAIEEYDEVIAPASIDLESIWNEHSDNLAYRIDDCRIGGQIVAAPLQEVTAQYVSSIQTIGPLPACAPAANMDAPKRLIMCASAQRQALIPLKIERPLVSTGVEGLYNIGVTTAKQFITNYLAVRHSNEQVQPDARVYLIQEETKSRKNALHAVFRIVNGEFSYPFTKVFEPCKSTMKGSLKYTRLAPMPHHEDGEYYALDDVICYNSDVDISETQFSKTTADYGNVSCDLTRASSNHGVAIGNNCRVLFKSFDGYTYEDSIVVTESFLTKSGLAVARTKHIEFRLRGANSEVVTRVPAGRYIPQLDEGYPIIGCYVQTGQEILYVSGIDENNKRYETTKVLGIDEYGYVLSCTSRTEKNDTIVRIELGDILNLEVGDKLEGLHGNKGVIGRIIKDSEAPYTEDGEVPDIILNPFGIVARLNLGQCIECTLGAVAEKTGEVQILEPFSRVALADILADAGKYGIVEKDIYDGRTGLKYAKKAMIGNMYMLRLEHTSVSKYNVTGDCRSHISSRTGQPQQGTGGGQRVSELGSWCISSYGADSVLSTLFTVQSDAAKSKRELDKDTAQNEISLADFSSGNIDFLQAYFHMLGAHLAVGDNITLELLTQKYIDHIAGDNECKLLGSTPQAILHNPDVFGTSTNNKTRCGKLPFGCKMIMPIFLRANIVAKLFRFYDYDKSEYRAGSRELLKSIRRGETQIVGWVSGDTSSSLQDAALHAFGITLPRSYRIPVISTGKIALPEEDSGGIALLPNMLSGIRGLVKVFEEYDVLHSLCVTVGANFGDNFSETYFKSQDLFPALKEILLFSKRYSTADFVVTHMLIPPVGYRVVNDTDAKMSNPIDAALSSVVTHAQYIQSQRSMGRDTPKAENALYKELEAVSFDTDRPANATYICLRKQLSDHRSKNSIMRDTLLSKRVSYSGRSVISIGPDLTFGQCGIPVCMLTTIFENHLKAVFREAQAHSQYAVSEFYRCITDKDTRYLARLLTLVANENLIGFKQMTVDRVEESEDALYERLSAKYNTQITNICELFDLCYNQLVHALEELCKTYPGLLNREPSLHKFSVQGFNIVPCRGHTIMLHPLNCHGFNADYDGDQMMCIVPMHGAAIKDVRARMMSAENVIDPKDGTSILALNQDMIFGLYWATIHKDNSTSFTPSEIACVTHLAGSKSFSSRADVGAASHIAQYVYSGVLNIHDTILCNYEGRWYLAEAGKIILNSLLPGGIGFTTEHDHKADRPEIKDLLPVPSRSVCQLLVDYTIKKGTLGTLEKAIADYFNNLVEADDEEDEGEAELNTDNLGAVYDRLMHFGFKMADLSGVTLSAYDLASLPVKKIIQKDTEAVTQLEQSWNDWYDLGMCTEGEHDDGVISAWCDASRSMKSAIKAEFESDSKSSFNRMDNIFMIMDSGARGNVSLLLEMAGSIGVVVNSAQKMMTTPVRNSYLEGLTPEQFMQNSYTGRRQVSAAQLTTAEAGQFTRSCIYLNEHLHIRKTDKRCSASGTWINLQYDTVIDTADKVYAEENNKFCMDEIMVQAEDVGAIPESIWASLAERMYGSDAWADFMKSRYAQFCNNMRVACRSTQYCSEVGHILELLDMSAFITKDNDGAYHIITVRFVLDKDTRNMLIMRVLDTDSMEKDEDMRGYVPVWRKYGFNYSGDAPASYDDPLVVSNELLDSIESSHIKRIPIFTILGCKSSEGICRHCFGVKYDTHQFPSLGEHIGYQAVQAVGNPLTQIILDSHKTEASTGPSKNQLITGILESSYKPEEVDPDNPGQISFALADGNIQIERAKFPESGIVINVVDTDGNIKQTLKTHNIEQLLTLDKVSKGEQIMPVSQQEYNKWMSCTETINVKVANWRKLCSCFTDDDILARNFEVFIRSLTEFGTAKQSDVEHDIIAGSQYSVSKLEALGIDYTPAFLCSSKTSSAADKILTTIAWEDAAAGIVSFVLTGIKETPDSNISSMLIGNYKGVSIAPHTSSVVDSMFASGKLEYVAGVWGTQSSSRPEEEMDAPVEDEVPFELQEPEAEQAENADTDDITDLDSLFKFGTANKTGFFS